MSARLQSAPRDLKAAVPREENPVVWIRFKRRTPVSQMVRFLGSHVFARKRRAFMTCRVFPAGMEWAPAVEGWPPQKLLAEHIMNRKHQVLTSMLHALS